MEEKKSTLLSKYKLVENERENFLGGKQMIISYINNRNFAEENYSKSGKFDIS